ncbi:MAG: PAS domain S-box protein, partial [SAR324 cluster bacterium]|nr:PAS domain S-box protein [SAR324 cluster bacterium]
MKNKAAQPAQALRPVPGVEEMALRIKSLEVELEQKNVLLEQGFAAFTQAAEKLQQSHKGLQRRIASLNLELAEKNLELEQNLVEKEKVKTYLSNIFESLPVGVFVMDLEGGVTSVNRAALDMIGLPAEQLMGINVNDVLGQPLFDFGPGGSPDGAAATQAGASAAESIAEPITYHRGEGGTLRLQVSFTPMEGDGATLGHILNLQDVTLLKRLEEQAERSNRFTAMGEMAANIAHEIRNPLGSIELFASLVKKGLAGNPEQRVL